MRMERNGRREALRNLSFHFIWERWCLFNISPQNRREGTLHIHRSCTHIYLIYVYMCMCVCIYSYIYTHTHPAVLFWKRKDNSAKHVLVVAWLQLLFSFLCPLWCLPNTVDLNEEKSLKTPPPRPSNLIKSMMMYVSIGMIESMKDWCLFVFLV